MFLNRLTLGILENLKLLQFWRLGLVVGPWICRSAYLHFFNCRFAAVKTINRLLWEPGLVVVLGLVLGLGLVVGLGLVMVLVCTGFTAASRQ